MRLTKEEITKEFKETAHENNSKQFDQETSWAIFNGLVISYLKAKGQYNKIKEEKLNESIKKVILSLEKYAFAYKGDYKTDIQSEEYLSLCPEEIRSGLTHENLNEEMVMTIAEKVIQVSVENGVHEDGKMTIPDKKVSEASMAEFWEVDKTMELMYDQIIATRGEAGMAVAIDYYKEKAEKAVEDEIEYYSDNTNYLIKFYSGILLHATETEDEGVSI